MKLCSNVCNKSCCVCEILLKSGADLRLLLQNVKGLTFFGTHSRFQPYDCIIIRFQESI